MNVPFVNAGRASDMMWFSFGEERQVTDSTGKGKKVGEYALHVQCAWRIVGPEGILVGSSDIYLPPGSSLDIDGRSHFNWDVPGGNRCDVQMERFFLEQRLPLVVETIEVDLVGGMKIRLAKGFALEVLPTSSADIEQWRVFQPGIEGSHFVVKGNGIQSGT
jgi:hypothetical protein